MMKTPSLICLVASLLLVAGFQSSARAETLVPQNADWRWAKGTAEASSPASHWRTLSFDDATWLPGPMPFHYGEGMAGGTLIPDMRYTYSSIFLRHTFTVTDAARFTNITLRAACDDGFIAWINGVEIARYNVRPGEIPFDDFAAALVSEPISFDDFVLPHPSEYLVEGPNVLAIQVFNITITSSDLQMDAGLSGDRTSDTTPPVIQSFSPPAGTVSGLASITVEFSEPVTGVVAADLLVNGEPASGLAGSGTLYTFSFVQPLSGVVAVNWNGAHAISDFSGNRFDDTTPGWEYLLIDTSPPAIIAIEPAPEATVTQLTRIRVTFDEQVTGVDADDLLVNGQPAARVTGSSAGPYEFEFLEPPLGAVDVQWSAGSEIFDLADPANPFEGGSWTYLLSELAVAGDVVINEFLAVNQTGRADEDGERPDWIEIHNRGADPANLLGWSLTDNLAAPGQWQFPNITLAPGAYLVVFASGKSRAPANGSPLHTNFKLSGEGEFLGLFNADALRQAATLYAPAFPEQRPDISYGIDSTGAFSYFAQPTPGGPNASAQLYSGVTAMPVASVQSGFFNHPIQVHLHSATPGATLYYTLDGKPPGPSTGTQYAGPISIAGTSARAVVQLRAAAYRDGFLPSRVTTHSYLFPEHILAQPSNPAGLPATWGSGGASTSADYEMDPRVTASPAYAARALEGLLSIPSLSLVLDPDDLFDPATGIYANPSREGLSWERETHAELIAPDGSERMKIDCGLRIQGGSSTSGWKSKKVSMRLLFKGDYGSSKLVHRFFPGSPVIRFDRLVLDAHLNLAWTHPDHGQRVRSQYVRDAFVADLQRATGNPSPHSRFVHLYLNGLYWGLYDVHEQPDAAFAEEYFGGVKEEYDVFRHSGSQLVDGTASAWNSMISIARSGLSSNSQYELLQSYLDVAGLADYMIVNLYAGNDDWPRHNWYAARRRVPGAGFKFFSWDAEHVLKSTGTDVTSVSNNNSPAELYALLRDNAEFRLLFADRVHRHFFNGGPMHVDPSNPAWDAGHPERNRPAALYMKRIAEIDPAIILESARWGDALRSSLPYTRDVEWQAELNWLLDDYFPKRSGIVLNQFKSGGLYPAVAAPAFNRASGPAPMNFNLTMTAPTGTIYYTTNGIDPRVYGSGTVATAARTYSGALPLRHSATVKARARGGSDWSALNEATFAVHSPGVPLRITEIMYNPPGGDPYEFIELQNIGSTAFDAGGFSFEGIQYSFPPSTLLAPGQVIVLASILSPSSFAARYPGLTVSGYFRANLANGGERLALLDTQGRTVLSADYQTSNGWPLEAGGQGRSLEIIDPNGDPDDPANWRASSVLLGTPGTVSPTPPLPPLRINEFMADNAGAVAYGGAFPDWIELHNASTAPFDLTGWSITDDGNPRRFVFPPGTMVSANDYLVLWSDNRTGQSGLHVNFALNRAGEGLFLYDSSTNRVDAVSFGPQLGTYTAGRIDGVWRLCNPTPGAPNTAASLAPAGALAINEWLADSPPGADDWLELHNRHQTLPAVLQGLHLGANNTQHRIGSLSFLSPSGHQRFWADEQPGPNHLDFKLPASGGAIILFDETGAELDRIDYGPQAEGISEGRLPDGSSTIAAFSGTSSPGASNFIADYSGPVLNECLARSATAGWIELHNPGTTTFDLGGMSLSINRPQPAQWVFPENSLIEPGAFIVIPCDGSRLASGPAESNWNIGLSLDASSGGVYLFNRLGQRVDAVEFGFQVDGQSIGRDATGEWRLLAVPTPGAINAPASTLAPSRRVRINEWMAQIPGTDDWFELFNPSNFPAELTGLFLTDDPSLAGQARFQIGPLSFIGAQDFVLYVASGSPSAGRNHVNFSLAVGGETIGLYGQNLSFIDAVYFGPQQSGISQGRLPDGSDQIVTLSAASPGRGNAVPQNEDADQDGMPGEWERLHGFDPDDPSDALLDADGDGLTNLEEYLAGTDPRDSDSLLRIETIELDPDGASIRLRFNAMPNRSYTFEQSDSAAENSWQKLSDIPEGPSARSVEITAPANGARYFRIRTPQSL